MCGIIAIAGSRNVVPEILTGLRQLAYRGYDSAGIAVAGTGRLDRRRAPGKLEALADLLDTDPVSGFSGIGHTRWATHGRPVIQNAHPHGNSRVYVVHNGIIENHADLRRELEGYGYTFESDTDTEVCPHLVSYYMSRENRTPEEAFGLAAGRLRGAFALAAVFPGTHTPVLCACNGSPLVIGHGTDAVYAGSDAHALAPFTNRITCLEDGDRAAITRTGFRIVDRQGAVISRPETVSSVVAGVTDKGTHRHFMAKEIYEQPDMLARTLAAYIDTASLSVTLPAETGWPGNADRMVMSACGTAFYACMIAKYWFETWAGLCVDTAPASELRYADTPWTEGGQAVFISQSGETADTLAALRTAHDNGQKTAAIVNVPESSIARRADTVFPLAAGPEIGVASTKAFTCQLAVLACMAIAAGRKRGVLDRAQEKELVREMLKLPRKTGEALRTARKTEAIAREIARSRDVLYIGRGVSFPLAMEGALKLKEISYIHAEGYAAGELKHGPIALVDENLPVVVIAPHDRHFEKTLSGMREVMARDGKVLLVSCAAGIEKAGKGLWNTIEMPHTHPLLAPVVYAVPVQLLAYHTAAAKGTDIDQPRNLAKSVTVE